MVSALTAFLKKNILSISLPARFQGDCSGITCDEHIPAFMGSCPVFRASSDSLLAELVGTNGSSNDGLYTALKLGMGFHNDPQSQFVGVPGND